MYNCDANTIPGKNIVLLKKLVCKLDKKYGNIILPHTYAKNASLGVAQVVKLGITAKEETGLNEGDYVLYDYYSVFQDTDDYVITKFENIILQLTYDEAQEYASSYVIKD